ncbi:hypothetical protein PJP10_24220 [Mycobacterium kansasii]
MSFLRSMRRGRDGASTGDGILGAQPPPREPNWSRAHRHSTRRLASAGHAVLVRGNQRHQPRSGVRTPRTRLTRLSVQRRRAP